MRLCVWVCMPICELSFKNIQIDWQIELNRQKDIANEKSVKFLSSHRFDSSKNGGLFGNITMRTQIL